jgi:hypothetical protein
MALILRHLASLMCLTKSDGTKSMKFLKVRGIVLSKVAITHSRKIGLLDKTRTLYRGHVQISQ